MKKKIVDWLSWKRMACYCFFAGLLSVPAVNFVVDPYEVFGTRLFPFSVSNANMRYLKFEQMRTQRFDALLAGSSVTQMIDPRWIVDGDANAFNLAAFSVDTLALELMLREAVKHVKPGGNVIIGLDPALFIEAGDRGPAFKLHPDVSGESLLGWWKDYLFAASMKAIGYKIAGYFGPQNIELSLEHGHYRLVSWDTEMRTDPLAYRAKKFTSKEVARSGEYVRDAGGVERIERIARTLGETDVVVTWVLMPVHPLMRAHIGEEQFSRLYADILGVLQSRGGRGDVIDLREHPLTQDNGLWYEHRHFAPTAAKIVAAEIRNAISSSVVAALRADRK